MKKKALRKDIAKSFTKSWGRFFSIVCLMALGSFALVGLKVTGPDMRLTAENYFQELELADLSIMSDYGLDEADQAIINQTENTDAIEYGYLKDVTIENTQTSLRVFSQPDKISQFELTEGTFPKTTDEIVISDQLKNQYNINDTINLAEPEDIAGNTVLVNHRFKIVGYVNSSEIISSANLGPSTTGTGDLTGYAVVVPETFDSDVYMMARLVFNDTEGIDPYSSEYTAIIQQHKDDIETLLLKQPDKRLASIQSDYQSEIDDGKQKIDDAETEISDNEAKLNDAKAQLDDAQTEIQANETKLNDAESQVSSSGKELTDAKAQLQSKEKELNEQKALLKQKEEEFNQNSIQLKTQQEKLASAQGQIDESQKQLDASKAQIEVAKSEYESGIALLKQNISALEQQQNSSEQLYALRFELQQTEAEFEAFMSQTYEPSLAKITASQEQLNESKKEITASKEKLEQAQQELNAAKQELDTGKQKLTEAESELSVAQAKIAQNDRKLQSAESEINTNEQKLSDAKQELADKETEYEEKNSEFQTAKSDAETKIAENNQTLADAQETLDELETPIYTFSTRREIPGSDGYKIYNNIATIIDALSNVFPVFLYFVAALVTVTTMTRFVDEERTNLGTLKALGYGDHDIIKKFTVYGLISSVIGTIIGVITGHLLLPEIVYTAYKVGFTLPKIECHFDLGITLIAFGLAIISAVLPAYMVAKKALKEKPSQLLLPKPPVAGSKIWLEHIPFIWNRMSFTHKVTARNIFRYKKRMLMTIFGVSGAVALLFTGFGMQYSISGINQRQFGDIIRYDLIVAENDHVKESQQQEINTMLTSDTVEKYSPVHYEEVSKVAGVANDEQPIKLIVPQDEDAFADYIALINRKTDKPIQFSDDGAVISERLAKLLNVKVGDTVTMQDAHKHDFSMTITDITEMYMGHFLFMNQTAYENAFNQDYKTNAELIILKDGSINNAQTQATKFMQIDGVKGVVQNSSLVNLIDTIVNALDMIMKVLIVVATLLAIVILYNLTNINVSERIRELSTIKVLGFYNKEVTMYIYRETSILSLLGILAGYIFGFLLHRYIITTVPPDDVMFNPTLWVTTFAIPAVIIIITLVVLGFFVNRRLSKVNMLEALKSVD